MKPARPLSAQTKDFELNGQTYPDHAYRAIGFFMFPHLGGSSSDSYCASRLELPFPWVLLLREVRASLCFLRIQFISGGDPFFSFWLNKSSTVPALGIPLGTWKLCHWTYRCTGALAFHDVIRFFCGGNKRSSQSVFPGWELSFYGANLIFVAVYFFWVLVNSVCFFPFPFILLFSCLRVRVWAYVRGTEHRA